MKTPTRAHAYQKLRLTHVADPNGNRNKISGMPEIRRGSKRQTTRPLNTYFSKKEKIIRRICGNC
uniref:Uncharacterized protein n=1 Tax=Onchocerca volvulus TaxID=6282 RepID=A0A8R1XZL2_ONCVO